MKTLPQFLNDEALTQVAFAKRVGTSQANVSKLCGVRPSISLSMALRIAAITRGEVPVEVWAVHAPRHANTPAPVQVPVAKRAGAA